MNIKSIVNYAKNIEKNNAAFAKLEKAEQRVAIAKDAIAQLLLGNYEALTGEYVNAEDVSLEDMKGVEVPECQVCAIGSVLVSAFRMTGDANCIRDLGYSLYADFNRDPGDIEAFREKTLREMESTFEGYICDDNDLANRFAWDEPVDEIMFVCDDDARLFAILENIIENEGAYKPGKVKTKAQIEAAKKKADKTTARFEKARTKARAAFAGQA